MLFGPLARRHHRLPKFMHLVARAKSSDLDARSRPTGEFTNFLDGSFFQMEQSNDESIDGFEADQKLID